MRQEKETGKTTQVQRGRTKTVLWSPPSYLGRYLLIREQRAATTQRAERASPGLALQSAGPLGGSGARPSAVYGTYQQWRAVTHCTCHSHPQQRGSAHLCLWPRCTVATPDSRIRTRGAAARATGAAPRTWQAGWLRQCELCVLCGGRPLNEYLDTLFTSQPRFFGYLRSSSIAPRMERQPVWIHSGQAPSQHLGVGFGLFGLGASKVARRVSTGSLGPNPGTTLGLNHPRTRVRPASQSILPPGLRMKHPYARMLNSLLDRSSLLVPPLNLSSLTTSGTDLAFVGGGEKNVSVSVALFSLPFPSLHRHRHPPSSLLQMVMYHCT